MRPPTDPDEALAWERARTMRDARRRRNGWFLLQVAWSSAALCAWIADLPLPLVGQVARFLK
jgi:hypothetical protein